MAIRCKLHNFLALYSFQSYAAVLPVAHNQESKFPDSMYFGFSWSSHTAGWTKRKYMEEFAVIAAIGVKLFLKDRLCRYI